MNQKIKLLMNLADNTLLGYSDNFCNLIFRVHVAVHTAVKFIWSIMTIIVSVTQPRGRNTASISTGEVRVGTVGNYNKNQQLQIKIYPDTGTTPSPKSQIQVLKIDYWTGTKQLNSSFLCIPMKNKKIWCTYIKAQTPEPDHWYK
jgi:hypothetical protein